MKKHIDIKLLLAGLFLLMLALPFASCDNDDDDGLPVIHRVRSTDPELKDSAFVKAKPGQMIVIEGENFSSVKKVYINGQEIYFNPNYVTSKTIIIDKIPDELELTGTNPELPKEIRVENKKGSASYSFHVLSPAPAIKRIEVKYPINPGDRIIIHGENFYEIEKIMLQGLDDEGEPTGVDVEVTQYTLTSKDYDTILFGLPEGAAEKGVIVLYCAAGKALYPYATVVQPPTVTSFSSDMPVIGTEFFITGTYFIDVEKVNINGEYDILAEDLRVSQSYDTIYMKLPTEPAAYGNITVTAAGGVSDDDKLFYVKEYTIANFDDIGSLSWAGKLFVGDGQNPPYISTGNAAGDTHENVGAPLWWFGNVLANIEYNNVISEQARASDLVVRFECFVTYPLKTITLQVQLGEQGGVSGYVPKSRTSGKTEIGKWMTCQIPLSMLAEDATTYGDVKALKPLLGFFAKNGDNGEVVPKFEIYYDNIRIVVK